MVAGSSVKMAASPPAGFEDFERDVEAILQEPNQGGGRAAALDLDSELSPYRSGSAPPTVEGARAAAGRLFAHAGTHHENGLSEEEMRAHPSYLSYYYSSEHPNPRLPPPMLSKEDWRAAQRFHAFGGIGDRRRGKESLDGEGGSSLFSLQPGLPTSNGERQLNELYAASRGLKRNLSRQQSAEWFERGTDGLISLADTGLGERRKSFVDVIQEELGRSSSVSEHLSRPASRNAFDNAIDPMRVPDSQVAQLHRGPEIIDGLHSISATPNHARVQSLGSSMSHSFASALNSPAKSTTPNHQLIGRSPSPCLPPSGGRISDSDKKTIIGSNGIGGISSRMADSANMIAALSSLSLSKNVITDGTDILHGQFHQEINDQPEMLSIPNTFASYNDLLKENVVLTDLDQSNLASNGQINLQKQLSNNLYTKVASVGSNNRAGSGSHYHSANFTGSDTNIYSASQGQAMLNNQLDSGPSLTGGVEGLYLKRTGSQVGSGFHVPIGDPLYAQYLQGASDSAAQSASRLDPSLGRNYLGNSQLDFSAYQEAHLGALFAQRKLQYDMSFINKSIALNHGFYGSPAFGLGMTYPASPISSAILSSLGPGSPLRHSERLSQFPTMVRSAAGGSTGSWNPENGVMEEGFGSSLLDEFKNNKTRSYELSDIVDHVVQFSVDQFGSRFIQQKLETASVEEKNKIFPEILPHARALMTDVFGNYVIQKFFEHGTEIQRKQMASQLIGHVLALSLQMYGCRVIQKALEVVDVDYQTQMVLELDGLVMKCVRDQNGNHVIQKCIECVPQDKIQFIISAFYGQVAALSTHPYGCRVIQRVLEHCDDPKTQIIMMDEILQSVCTLAQDQYGNYVVQHVLQHGQPEERSAIISKLAGQIVKMSQQKFASNVIEKCLTYGGPEQRQLLINEMLGSTDENEPLQAMMKDQFGNYVVQKVLETCDDQNRELILSRIKAHLNALKKYTYGKHIVARVEKLIATGERHSGNSSYSS